MYEPLVSIVIPIYDQENFVVEAVASAVDQTHRNLQIIVVDDGSTDSGAELLEREFGDRIELIRQRNRGPSAATNAGIAAARGEFIALLGGDDVCVRERIEIQLGLMHETGHDVVFSKPFLIDEHGSELPDSSFPIFFQEARPRPSLRALVLEGNFLCAPSALMRRDVVDRVGVFRPGLIQLQDYDYWLRATARGLSLEEIEPRIVRYRRHPRNLSTERAGFASSAELLPVIRAMLEHGDPIQVRAAFAGIFEPVIDETLPLSLFDKALFLLAHPRDEVRSAGVEYLIPLFEDNNFCEKADRVNFDLFRFARNV